MLRFVAFCTFAFGALAAAAQSYQQLFSAVTPQNFDSGGEISRQFHLNAESYLRSTTIARTGETLALKQSLRADLAALEVSHGDGTSNVADYVQLDPLLDSVIVLHGGEIVFEAYPHMEPRQRHFAWSVTKVLTSATLATLVAEDMVDMSAAVEQYVPALQATAWAGTPIRDIANMASGIDCRDSDGYQNTNSCIYRLEEALGITAPTGSSPKFLEHTQSMKRLRPAGTANEYLSANTNVLMLVIEQVTGRSYADAVRSRIWERIDAEADALMAISAEGYAYASGGLMARLRDLARFGLVFTEPDRFSDVAATMIAELQAGGGIALREAQQRSLVATYGDDAPTRAGWQWDLVWDDGGLYKGGYLGQGLYVDPHRDLVIAWFGTGLDFSAKQTAMLPIARQLATSGLFEKSSLTASPEPPVSTQSPN